MLSSELTVSLDAIPAGGLAWLSENLPMAWIEEALFCSGSASILRRRLPAEQVVWLVIALALYRYQSMPEVLETLDLALPRRAPPFVSKSAITQAWRRLGQAPLAQLFEVSAKAWCAQEIERYW